MKRLTFLAFFALCGTTFGQAIGYPLTNTGGGSGGGNVATDTIWTAKGDIAIGLSAGSAGVLHAGTDGQIIVFDAASTGGMKAIDPTAKSIQDPTSGYKATFDTSALSSNRVYATPDAAATWVVPLAPVSHYFVDGVGADGVPMTAQPSGADLALTDVTTNNATTSNHGFIKKLNGTASTYMDGTGAWSTPAGGGGAGAAVGESSTLVAYQALGSALKGLTVAATYLGTSTTLNNQTVRWTAVYIPRAVTLTGVMWYQSTQGNYTSNNYNGVGLYTMSGGTMTQVAVSTDDGTIWKAAGGTFPTKAFSATYAAAAGVYYVALIWNNSALTTSPVIGCLPGTLSSSTATFDFPNSIKTDGTVGAQTVLPSTRLSSAISVSSTRVWIGLY